ncbi:MAG: cupin domain-containing protein, partial [Gemmatimonadaceae bacterium]
MGQRIVPVTLGSPQFQRIELDGLRVTATQFPPSLVIPPHVHDRTVVAVMVEGSFDLVIRNRTVACNPATVLVEPAGERHANKVHRFGARTLVIEPTPLYELENLAECRRLLTSPVTFAQPAAWAFAARLRGEVSRRDSFTEVAVEELALRLLSSSVETDGDRERA